MGSLQIHKQNTNLYDFYPTYLYPMCLVKLGIRTLLVLISASWITSL